MALDLLDAFIEITRFDPVDVQPEIASSGADDRPEADSEDREGWWW